MSDALGVELAKWIFFGATGYFVKEQLETAAARGKLAQTAAIDLHQLITSAEALLPAYAPLEATPKSAVDLVSASSGCIWTSPFVPVASYLDVSSDGRLHRRLMLVSDRWKTVDQLGGDLAACHRRLLDARDFASPSARADLVDYLAYREETRRALAELLVHASAAAALLLDGRHGALFALLHRRPIERFLRREYGLDRRALRERARRFALVLSSAPEAP